MAKLRTLYLPDVPDEEGVVWTLGPELDAGWFPEYDLWSMANEDGFVSVHFDTRHFLNEIEPDAAAALPGRLGFVPRAVFHVEASNNFRGTVALAEQVLDILQRAYGGRTLDAEPAVTG